MRKAAIGVTAACLTLSLAGCGSSSGDDLSTADTGVANATIGIAMPTTTSVRWIDDGNNISKQFQAKGYKVNMKYAENDVEKQISQIQQMIDQGDKLLVIGAIDGSKLKDVLHRAAAARIPVISYDRLIRDTPDVDYYATFDNYKVGVLQGTHLVERLGLKQGKGPFKAELFAGSPDDNNATFFYEGAMSVLKPYIESRKLVVPSGQTERTDIAIQQWDPKLALERMQKLLAGPDKGTALDAILSPNDDIATGIAPALQAAGYGKAKKKWPVITGQDATLPAVKAVLGGTMDQTVYKDTRQLARVTVQMGDALLNGLKPDVNDTKQYDNGVKTVPTFLLQPVSVNRDNYKQVLVDSGYYTMEQLTQ